MKKLVPVSALGLVLFALTISSWARPVAKAPTAAIQSNGGRFTCEATLLRVENVLGNEVELGAANEDEEECNTDNASLLFDDPIQVGGNLITADLLYSRTFDETEGGAKQGRAESGVANVLIDAGSVEVEVELLTAEATAGPCPSTALSGDSTVFRVRVNNLEIEVPDDGEPFTLDLSPVTTLHLNWESNDGTTITRRALFLEDTIVFGDIVVAEAVADVHGNPCGPTPTPSATTPTPTPTGTGSPTPGPRHDGFLTGGSWVAEIGSKWDRNNNGTVEPGTRVGASASLDCFTAPGVDPRNGHHHLGVRWTDENDNEKSNFKLTELDDTRCLDTAATANPPRSSWDTMEGEGRGVCTSGGVSVTVDIRFRFTDDGEPGRDDSFFIDTDLADGAETPDGLANLCDYESEGFIDAGNIQAHDPGGRGGSSNQSGNSHPGRRKK